jgi:hypothetical protein
MKKEKEEQEKEEQEKEEQEKEEQEKELNDLKQAYGELLVEYHRVQLQNQAR